jgi:hypothetical protein
MVRFSLNFFMVYTYTDYHLCRASSRILTLLIRLSHQFSMQWLITSFVGIVLQQTRLNHSNPMIESYVTEASVEPPLLVTKERRVVSSPFDWMLQL